MGVASHRCINDDASMVRLLVECALEVRVIAVRGCYGCLEIIDNHPRCHAAKEFPSVFDAVDQVIEPLAVGNMDILVAAEDRSDGEGVEDPLPACVGVVDFSKPAEV